MPGLPSHLRRHLRGQRAERVAAWALRFKGYRILAWRVKTPVGEIDLVAARGRIIAFVEVKRRPRIEDALESLSLRQQRRISRAGLYYLQKHPFLADRQPRFDLIALAPGWRIRHIPNAWEYEA